MDMQMYILHVSRFYIEVYLPQRLIEYVLHKIHVIRVFLF
jgi:hypothetical protein